jgi:cell division protein FtsN
MRILICFIIGTVLLATSCASTKKKQQSSESQDTENYIPGTTAKKTLRTSKPVEEEQVAAVNEEKKSKEVKEVEKRLVSDNEIKISPYRYFVIVGSFRDPDNAKNRQSEIEREGFRSEILKTEEGLYRISVLATDDVNEARNEVRRIWVMFPQYSDTWMLLKKIE